MTKEAQAMTEQRFPAGWDEQRVKRLLAELEARTEREWVAADEAAALGGEDQAVVTVPAALLPEIRRLLAAHKTVEPGAAAGRVRIQAARGRSLYGGPAAELYRLPALKEPGFPPG